MDVHPTKNVSILTHTHMISSWLFSRQTSCSRSISMASLLGFWWLLPWELDADLLEMSSEFGCILWWIIGMKSYRKSAIKRKHFVKPSKLPRFQWCHCFFQRLGQPWSRRIIGNAKHTIRYAWWMVKILTEELVITFADLFTTQKSRQFLWSPMTLLGASRWSIGSM